MTASFVGVGRQFGGTHWGGALVLCVAGSPASSGGAVGPLATIAGGAEARPAR